MYTWIIHNDVWTYFQSLQNVSDYNKTDYFVMIKTRKKIFYNYLKSFEK